MYMGDPHSVAAIMLLWRYRAKPKSAGKRGAGVSPVSQDTDYYHPYHTPLLLRLWWTPGGVEGQTLATIATRLTELRN